MWKWKWLLQIISKHVMCECLIYSIFLTGFSYSLLLNLQSKKNFMLSLENNFNSHSVYKEVIFECINISSATNRI